MSNTDPAAFLSRLSDGLKQRAERNLDTAIRTGSKRAMDAAERQVAAAMTYARIARLIRRPA